MDATAMALKQSLVCSSSSYCVHSKVERISGGSVYIGRRGRPLCELLSSGFCDQGHLQYYNNNSSSTRFGGCASASVISEKEEKSCKEKKKKTMKKKKQLKLLKGLTRDLSTFSQIGFGLDSDAALLDQVKGNIISEAAEALTEQLQKMRAQEKEAKRKLKEEKARLKHGLNCEMSSSSSSSSESSDSDCGEVIDMNQLKRSNSAVAEQPLATTAAAAEAASSCEGNTKKVEVCMGGKCRKSGGGALMEEFGRAGVAAAGCKCMGKCRDGPNVKVLSEGAPSVCVGVGMEDVGMIVAKLLEENHNQLGFAAAAASAS